MSLSSEYKNQNRWRSWPRIFAALPQVAAQRVLDLGCGIGDQAAELTTRGAHVLGIDSNEELLREARSRGLPNASFQRLDLRTLGHLGEPFDGIWCSFTAAYFPDLPNVLPSWLEHLKPGRWVAFIEVDDLFGHEPLSADVKELLTAYAEDALKAGRYDFHMGSKLAGFLERAGVAVATVFTVEDRELSFAGPADADVVEAWDLRLARMKLLQSFCGAAFSSVREEFLGCLKRLDHHSRAQVYCCLGNKRTA